MASLKVAIMTGTGQGIGKGCAIEMAKAGYKVSLMSPSNRSVELAEELGGIGRRGSVLEVEDLQASVNATSSEIALLVKGNMGEGELDQSLPKQFVDLAGTVTERICFDSNSVQLAQPQVAERCLGIIHHEMTPV